MKLKEYLENLNNFVKENPDALDLEVIYSSDDEGNDFQAVHYTPQMGIFEDLLSDKAGYRGEFISSEQLEDWDRSKDEINAICIN
jgi:hypothetical protein